MRGTEFGGPSSKDYSILWSIEGFPDFGKLQCQEDKLLLKVLKLLHSKPT